MRPHLSEMCSVYTEVILAGCQSNSATEKCLPSVHPLSLFVLFSFARSVLLSAHFRHLCLLAPSSLALNSIADIKVDSCRSEYTVTPTNRRHKEVRSH